MMLTHDMYYQIMTTGLFGGRAPGWYYGQISADVALDIGMAGTLKYKALNFNINVTSLNVFTFTIGLNSKELSIERKRNKYNSDRFNRGVGLTLWKTINIAYIGDTFLTHSNGDYMGGTQEIISSGILPNLYNIIENGTMSSTISYSCILTISISINVNFFYEHKSK